MHSNLIEVCSLCLLRNLRAHGSYSLGTCGLRLAKGKVRRCISTPKGKRKIVLQRDFEQKSLNQ